MKTLNDVIKAMDGIEDFTCTCCDLQVNCDEGECFYKDALHYLKEYNWMDKALDPSKRDKNEDIG